MPHNTPKLTNTRSERILNAIKTLEPSHVQLDNESDNHGGNSTESHFKLVVVAQRFTDEPQIQRHRMVYGQLQQEFDSGLHALALHTYTPDEWSMHSVTPESPPCAK